MSWKSWKGGFGIWVVVVSMLTSMHWSNKQTAFLSFLSSGSLLDLQVVGADVQNQRQSLFFQRWHWGGGEGEHPLQAAGHNCFNVLPRSKHIPAGHSCKLPCLTHSISFVYVLDCSRKWELACCSQVKLKDLWVDNPIHGKRQNGCNTRNKIINSTLLFGHCIFGMGYIYWSDCRTLRQGECDVVKMQYTSAGILWGCFFCALFQFVAGKSIMFLLHFFKKNKEI